ncbi:MAG: polysaccharide biosynthesis C-terminal domain-containing protein [Ignavibacteria bacterium]|nr:polysaccharide biosynthesis C-terminal domain-containing protein [Ignavibacteria bacterium]MDH7527412.1 polysaccharide biosynthesis C-terminal domain-containing protein [Ignavibacteria bacterium]
MKKELKQLGKETAIYGISTIVGRFLSFLLVPFFTNVFSQAEYGIITNVYAYIAFFNIIYLYGMDSAYLKYASTQELGNEKQTFSTAFNSVFLTSFLLSILILIFKEPLTILFGLEKSQLTIVYFVAGILFFDAVSNVIFARLRFHNKALRFASFKLLNIISNVVLNIVGIFIWKLGPLSVFLAGFGSSLFTFVLLLPDLIKSYQSKIDKSILQALLKFGLPFIPAGLASIVTQVIDRPILLALTDASTVGVYQANYKLGIFMMLFVSMFQYAWQPFYLKQSLKENAKELFAKVLTYFTLFAFTIFIILSLFIEDLVRIKFFGFYLIGKDFWDGLYIVPIVLLAYVFNGFYINFLAGIQIQKKTQYMPLVSGLGAIVNVVSNFILIPLIGMLGAAYATLLAYFAMAVFQYFLSQRFYRIKYEWRKVFLIGISSILSYVVFLLVNDLNLINALLLKILVIALYLISLGIFGLIEIRWIREFYYFLLKRIEL